MQDKKQQESFAQPENRQLEGRKNVGREAMRGGLFGAALSGSLVALFNTFHKDFKQTPLAFKSGVILGVTGLFAFLAGRTASLEMVERGDMPVQLSPQTVYGQSLSNPPKNEKHLKQEEYIQEHGHDARQDAQLTYSAEDECEMQAILNARKKAFSRTVEWYYSQLLTEANITDPQLTVEDYRDIFKQLQISLNFELKFGNEGDDIVNCEVCINGKSWRIFGRDAGRNNALADLCRVLFCRRKMWLDLLDPEHYIRLKTTLNSHGASFVVDRGSSFSGLLSNQLQSSPAALKRVQENVQEETTAKSTPQRQKQKKDTQARQADKNPSIVNQGSVNSQQEMARLQQEFNEGQKRILSLLAKQTTFRKDQQ
ncbi:hypothetical protein MP228_006755 [Amoeboaphelidium protococcarum]|nr:hypothetical protein MP228_006755 [Amoeboaphelidium protococcarum]